MVNLFAHRFLLKRAEGDATLSDPAQIGIEVAVPQVTGSSKKLVRKDLVLWPRPMMTAWSPMGGAPEPAVIIEWKRDSRKAARADAEWLARFTRVYPGVLGFAVCICSRAPRHLEWWEVENGGVTGPEPHR